MKLNKLVYNILALTLIYIFFLFFKGPTNILNALFVPFTIYIFSYKNDLRERIIFYGAVILFCALFFNIQIFFVIVYCFIAAILRIIYINKFKIVSSLFLLTASVSFFFYLGIVLTDMVFQTNINSIIMKIIDSNIIIYLVIIIIQATIVSTLLLWFSRLFIKRIRFF